MKVGPVVRASPACAVAEPEDRGEPHEPPRRSDISPLCAILVGMVGGFVIGAVSVCAALAILIYKPFEGRALTFA